VLPAPATKCAIIPAAEVLNEVLHQQVNIFLPFA